jgi:transposase
MEKEGWTLGPRQLGAEVLDAREVQGIFGLLGRGWRVKAIARELGMARNTVRAWVRRGPDADRPRTGRPLALVGHEVWLKARFLAGVRNADVLRQELADRGLLVSIRTVERFVSPLRAKAVNAERATLRFETEPGQQMQIDFEEKWIVVAGERVKAFVFVATLGYSRSTFAHVYPNLRQRHWLEGLEAALHHFGGVPESCVVDNAKALVLRWQGDRPVFHPEFEAFCCHWGMKPRACRPYRPRTKGKVERGVGYVKGNALGRVSWASWEALHGHLTWWMRYLRSSLRP